MDNLFIDAVGDLLADRCTPQIVRDIEAGGSPAALWEAIEASGFADALVDESQGGAGLGLADAFGLFETFGAHTLPVPLGETMIARAILARSGMELPHGSIALARARTDAAHAVVCESVRCGRVADFVLVARGEECRLLARESAQASPSVFCLDAALAWPESAWAQAPRVSGEHDLHALQACLYAAQLAGAMMSVFSRTLQYANDRQQFGRPIGKFQAIQHQLGVMSEHTFAARMAAQIGCQAPGVAPDRLRVAVAKARASEAAVEVAALAHSIHGAIGFTREFDLQLYTRRLNAWRQAAGSESYWHDVLGEALLGSEGPALDLLRATTAPH